MWWHLHSTLGRAGQPAVPGGRPGAAWAGARLSFWGLEMLAIYVVFGFMDMNLSKLIKSYALKSAVYCVNYTSVKVLLYIFLKDKAKSAKKIDERPPWRGRGGH